MRRLLNFIKKPAAAPTRAVRQEAQESFAPVYGVESNSDTAWELWDDSVAQQHQAFADTDLF